MTMTAVCVLFGGPTRHIHVRGKVVIFEDHPRLGPVLVGKEGDPLANQPMDTSPFWLAYEAWEKQGKFTKTVDGKAWCQYETHGMLVRRRNKDAAELKMASGPDCSASWTRSAHRCLG